MLEAGDTDSETSEESEEWREAAEELKRWLKTVDEDVLVVDGKVMAKCDLATDPVYYDVTLQAQWEKESESEPSREDAPGDEVGKTHEVGGDEYKVTSAAAGVSDAEGTAIFIRAKNAKKVVVPAKVTIDGKRCRVVAIAPKAFKSAKKKLKKAVVGKYVERIGKKAFAGCKKLKKVTVRTDKLTKKSVKDSLKKSSVKVVKVKVGKSKAKRACAKKYATFFTKANCGRRVVVKA